MNNIVIWGAVTIGIVLLAGGWYAKQQYDAEQRGIEKQIAITVAKSNQEIAARRERDADFDKNDARTICERDGLEWVFEDGNSFCR